MNIYETFYPKGIMVFGDLASFFFLLCWVLLAANSVEEKKIEKVFDLL